ncbi:MAG: hypothetical protein U0930_20570 [Pirellulales bacterium]
MSQENHAWQKLLTDYIRACHEDFLQRQSHRLNGPKMAFLARYGCDSIFEKHTAGISRVANTVSDPGDSIECNILHEVEDRIFLEILDQSAPPIYRQSPFEDIRLLLKRLDKEWRISGIFRRCYSCNLSAKHRNPGVCCYCKGGTLEEILGTCKYCKGSGRCAACGESEFEGWSSKAD